MSILFVFNFNVQFDSLWSEGGKLLGKKNHKNFAN